MDFAVNKIVVLNGKSEKAKKVASDKNVTREISPDFFQFGSVTNGDYCLSFFGGEVIDDPVRLSRLDLQHQPHQKTNFQNFDDKNIFTSVNLACTTRAWQDQNGEWKHRSTRIRLVIWNAKAQKMMSSVHKGDRVSGFGVLKNEISRDNRAARCYIQVEKMTVTRYKTIRNFAQTCFENHKEQQLESKYKTATDILGDSNLNNDQKIALLTKLNSDQQKRKQEATTQVEDNAAGEQDSENDDQTKAFNENEPQQPVRSNSNSIENSSSSGTKKPDDNNYKVGTDVLKNADDFEV